MDRPRGRGFMVDSQGTRAWLESTKRKGMALGLENTALAIAELDLPKSEYETVHVAGSNGKGTTVATLGAALGLANIDHVSFTSPHLVRVEERIRFNGYPVNSNQFDEALGVVHAMVERTQISLTFFEATLLIALVVASRLSIRVLLLETGLGGRLDATRAVHADVAVITSLSLEHTDILGDSLVAIAGEKAAIARPGRPLVVRQVGNSAVQQRIEACASTPHEPGVEGPMPPAMLEWVEMDEKATYHDEANAMAEATWAHLRCAENQMFPVIRGLRWPGRMHEVPSPTLEGMTYLLEGAHNSSGMIASCAQLSRQKRWREPWVLLLGSTPQSDMQAMLEPLVDLCHEFRPTAVVLTEPQFGRYPGVPCEELKAALLSLGIKSTAMFSEPEDAVQWIESDVSKATTVLCIGSLYLQGNLLKILGADSDADLAVLMESTT